ncbi:hypothetical protein Tco_1087307, partial [Tanacetum coccineum]
MEASSSKIILTMDVHYNGHFTRNPVTYAKGTKLTLHNIKSLAKGITILRCDDDLKEFVKLGSEHDGRISLYVCHSLEGGIDNEEEDKCGIENDKDEEHGDANSDVASVDHLSEGEEELRQAGKEFNPMLSNVESQEGENYVEPDVDSDRDMPKEDSRN